MKKFLLASLFASFASFAQDSGKSCDILQKISVLMQREHYNPKPIDDSLSVYVFETLMNELDENKNIFLKAEYDYLSKYKYKLDDYLRANDCSFFADFATTYKKGLERSKTTIEKIQKEKLDYNSNDTIRFTKKEYPFYVKAEDVEKVYTKRLKYDILEDISKTSKNLDSLQQHFATMEKASRAKIFETALCKINNRLETKESIEKEIRNDFYNVFCSYFDPHSSYFSYDTKSSFLSGLSTDNLSIGLYVTLNEKEEIIVEEIVPGGPASQMKIIEKGDQVLKVSGENGPELLVSCNSLELIGELIFSDSNKKIKLTLRKKNGNQYDVTLEKKIMKAEDHAVFSFIVSKENTRLGYINIPSFYTDFEGNTMQGTTDDVAREIFKLKQENVDGLIIDLQNNGGGSMEEAIRLSGMFIDSGPISVLADKRKNLKILKDSNRGMIYSGPLILLVNGNSASASEFFASAMQDYNRALLVGSTTLGKATMQQILPIDNNQQDFVKLTVEKFYRVTGKSHQMSGVIPDVKIPTLYDGIISRENSAKTALKNDQIAVKTRFKPFSRDVIANLLPLSLARVKTDSYFNEVALANEKIDTIFKKVKAPILMNFESIFNDVHAVDALFDEVKKLSETTAPFAIKNTNFIENNIKTDNFQKSINEFRTKNLKTNAYVSEAINIINDYKRLYIVPKN